MALTKHQLVENCGRRQTENCNAKPYRQKNPESFKLIWAWFNTLYRIVLRVPGDSVLQLLWDNSLNYDSGEALDDLLNATVVEGWYPNLTILCGEKNEKVKHYSRICVL